MRAAGLSIEDDIPQEHDARPISQIVESSKLTPRTVAIRLGLVLLWGLWWAALFHFASDKDDGSGIAAFVNSLVYGIPGALILPSIERRCRSAVVLGAVRFGAMVLIIIAGAPVVTAIVYRLGYVARSDLVAYCIGTMLVAFVIGMGSSIAIAAYYFMKAEIAKSRLKSARAELTRQRAERLAANAQLASLESRVRPHFLFNALNTAMNLVKEAPDDAERALEQLSDLLRFTLRTDPLQLLPLRDELTLVSNYLALEKERYGARLRYQIAVDERAKSAPVFPFLVQTLVENCVKYAVAPSLHGAEIRVDIRKEKKSICVCVQDDGPGFTEAAICEGHGLDNLRGRLEALYGDAARLQITQLANDAPGACVRVEFPSTD